MLDIQKIKSHIILSAIISRRRFQGPRGLSRWSAAARLLGLEFRIPPGA
jgi:hypothetical protein